MRNKSGPRSQSAMEYLMTYGWAILILTVVIGALYSMGIFGSTTSAPRAQPGSCRVFRPNGPGTTAYINLEGVCTGQLPQYVARFTGRSFSYVQLPDSAKPTGAHTISFWINPMTWNTASETGILGGYGQGAVGQTGGVAFTEYGGGDNNLWYSIYNSITDSYAYAGLASKYLPPGTWSFVAVTWDGTSGPSALKIYSNGGFAASGSGLVGPIVWRNGLMFSIGYAYTYPLELFNGSITNFQIYNTSLDANAIQNLYAEGIGGAPISPQYLVGWWPLNGNATDYSGNNNNGASTGVAYTRSWISGYQGH
jgi:Concanavalin A-like lectin/glucanases superfamily